jgi:hypothetical protein
MKKSFIILILLCSSFFSIAQTNLELNPIKKAYYVSASEFIFSLGNVEAAPNNTKDIVRFSGFLHLQQQVHYDFNEKFGVFTGLALRNIGIITDLNDSVRIKQRVYTLGVPVGFKVGNMNGNNLMLGFEAELAINYKQKVYVNSSKQKANIWFSNRTEIFLPSLFAQFTSKYGVYVRFIYYLTDFLVADKQKIDVIGVSYVPTKSSMAYISIGYTIPDSKL